jgi:hypothetical protein
MHGRLAGAERQQRRWRLHPGRRQAGVRGRRPPQVLQDRYGGWLSERVVADYLAYARAVFRALGDRVTLFATFNEPWTFCFNGYGTGGHAPGMPVRSEARPCV